MTKDKLETKFKLSIIQFLDELLCQFPTDNDMILCRILVKDMISESILIKNFIKYISPYKDKIAKRDETFFLEDESIISHITNFKYKSKINKLKVLWNSKTLDDDDKKQIWNWFDFFIIITDKYSEYVNIPS